MPENAVRALARPNSGPVALAVVGTLRGRAAVGHLEAFCDRVSRRRLSLRTANTPRSATLSAAARPTIGLRFDRDGSSDLDCDCCSPSRLQVRVRAGSPRAAAASQTADLRGER